MLGLGMDPSIRTYIEELAHEMAEIEQAVNEFALNNTPDHWTKAIVLSDRFVRKGQRFVMKLNGLLKQAEERREESGARREYVLTDGAEVFKSRMMTPLEAEIAEEEAKSATDGNLRWSCNPSEELHSASRVVTV